jgi:serine/threonine protein kinase
MNIQLHTGKFESLEIAETPLGEGSEGCVYEVINSAKYLNYVVKIYNLAARTPQRQAKVEYLIKFRPQLTNAYSVIFPEDIIYVDGQFGGFLMKKAPGEYDLTSLCALGKSSRLPSSWHEKFDRQTPQGMYNRFKICYNLASAMSQMHALGKYTFVDIKPENIKVGFNGEISLVDIDSIAIQNNYDLLFAAEKYTLEYSPAEWRKIDLKQDILEDSWDRFSLGVIFYKILLGLHPFAGTCGGNYSHLTSLEQKIVEGLLPWGSSQHNFEFVPEPHQKLKFLPFSIRNLFGQCFEVGHLLPFKRPSASDWAKVFKNAKPKDYPWLSLSQTTKTTLAKPSKEKSQSIDNQAIIRPKGGQVAVNSTSGLVPTLVIMGTFGLLSAGIMKYDSYLKQLSIQQKYGDLHKVIQKTDFQKKMDLIPKFQYVENLKDNVTWVLKNDKFGLIDMNGKALTDLKYDWVGRFYEKIAIVKVGNQYGYVSQTGRELTPLKYDNADNFVSGMAIAGRGENYWCIDPLGNEAFQLNCEWIGNFKEDLANFRQGGYYGFLNRKGKEIVPADYNLAYPFSEGLACVKKGDYFGFIDKQGKVVIPFKFTSATSFSRGSARVAELGDDFYWIDKQGNVLKK